MQLSSRFTALQLIDGAQVRVGPLASRLVRGLLAGTHCLLCVQPIIQFNLPDFVSRVVLPEVKGSFMEQKHESLCTAFVNKYFTVRCPLVPVSMTLTRACVLRVVCVIVCSCSTAARVVASSCSWRTTRRPPSHSPAPTNDSVCSTLLAAVRCWLLLLMLVYCAAVVGLWQSQG